MTDVDRDAIHRVLAGDADQYRVLMKRHLPAVLRMCLRVCGSAEDAEEAAHEAFLRAYQKLGQFRQQANFGTWVYRIAMNCALNLVERRARDPGWHAAEPKNGLPCSRPDPETILLQAEAALSGQQLLACLTPMERAAFVLRHFEGQPTAEIAAALSVTANTARQTIYRAVSKLRREFEQNHSPLTPIARTAARERKS